MLKTKHYRTERLIPIFSFDYTSYDHWKWGFSRIYILFQHRELRALFIFFFSPLTTHFYSFESLIYELKQ